MTIENDALTSMADAQQQIRLQHTGCGQKLAIYAIFLELIVLLGRTGLTNATDWAYSIALYLYCLVFVLAIFGIFFMARGLRLSSITIFIAVIFQFVPMINLLILLYLTVRATQVLRRAGYRVGLLGVKAP